MTTKRVVSYGAHFAHLIFAAALTLISLPFSSQARVPLQKSYLDSWHLRDIRAFEAWKTSKGDPSTVVAVVDSGIDYNRPELNSNMWRNPNEIDGNRIDDDNNGFVDDIFGWDFVHNRPDPMDKSMHGTLLANFIAGVEAPSYLNVGVCPRCNLMAVRFMNRDGLGDTDDAIKGLNYAVRVNTAKGARGLNKKVSVINFSFSGEGYDKDLYEAIAEAGRNDILVMAAASNDGLNLDRDNIYPAKFQLPNLVTVGASDRDRKLWDGSNWSPKFVHIAAPGSDLTGLWNGKWDNECEGTSDATAIASGAAALLRSAAPHVKAPQVREILIRTSRPSAALKSKVASGGVIDVKAALDCIMDSTLPCLKTRQIH